MRWVSNSIKYKEVRVYKNTFFGKKEKDGYELLEPLIFEYEPKVFFYLEAGYVFDGPSFPNFLQWLLGEKTSNSLMAASAMHDTMKNMPVKYGDSLRNTKFKIKESAKMYILMIELWNDNAANSFKRSLQYYGLINLQFIFTINSKEIWKKVEK